MPREQSQSRQGIPSVMPMMFPLQQFGQVFLENVEQVADFQMELARSYTHYAVRQWRDALEIHDPQSLRQFFERQSEATEEFTRKVTKDAERVMEATEQAARRGLRVVQTTGDQAAAGMRRSAEEAEQMGERIRRDAREMQQQAQEGGRQQQGKMPIENYDELSIDEIEQRLDKLNPDQLRQIRDYERKNKNRKTLSESLERRMQ